MSIDNTKVIDGVAINNKGQLILLMSDHLDWIDEYNHLLLLQDKINAYCAFCETKQYLSLYPGVNFGSAIIEIHFRNEPTRNALHFLSIVQSTLAPDGIMLECHVD